MDFNIEIRKKQLENLDQLISSSRDRVQSVLDYLGWTPENVRKETTLAPCPIDRNHRIPPIVWTPHIEKCLIKREGYDLNEQFLSEPLSDPTQSIYLDRNKKVEIITKELSERSDFRLAWNGVDSDPRTVHRLVSTFSPDERLAFYNYCVQNTTGPPPPPEFTTIHSKKRDEDKILTHEELLAQERNAKRRRTKYKSVHVNRKNHTEVMREVIDGQMDEYKEWLSSKEQNNKTTKDCNNTNKSNETNCDNKEKSEDQERPHSSVSRNSAHSGSSRSTSRRHDYGHRDRRGRSRDRRSRERDRSRCNDRRDHRESPRRSSHRESPRRSSHRDDKRREEDKRRSSKDRRRKHEDRDHKKRH